jgi:hypothetical protein
MALVPDALWMIVNVKETPVTSQSSARNFVSVRQRSGADHVGEGHRDVDAA